MGTVSAHLLELFLRMELNKWNAEVRVRPVESASYMSAVVLLCIALS